MNTLTMYGLGLAVVIGVLRVTWWYIGRLKSKIAKQDETIKQKTQENAKKAKELEDAMEAKQIASANQRLTDRGIDDGLQQYYRDNNNGL